MPDINTKYSVSSFQQCDGTNFSTAGVDTGVKVGSGNLGIYTGVGATFDGKPFSAIIDLCRMAKAAFPAGSGLGII